jgi:hypothetical protein
MESGASIRKQNLYANELLRYERRCLAKITLM